MPTLSTNTSSLGTHFRTTATADSPAVLRNIRPGATVAVACSADATARVELSISAPDAAAPLWLPSAAGTDGAIPPNGYALEEVHTKLTAIRVSVTGTGSATVEVLQ